MKLKKNASGCKDTRTSLYGPQLPSLAEKSSHRSIPEDKPDPDVESDDDDIIGPRLPSDGSKPTTYKQQQIDIQLEKRAQQIKGKSSTVNFEESAPKRESWMLELPIEKAKNFGLGPRQFSKSTGSKRKQDRSWTDTPEQKAKRS